MNRFVRLGLLVVVTAGILFGARLTGLDQAMTLEGMRAMVSSWGDLGPVVYVGLCIAGILLYLPESLLLAFGGALFGGWPAFLYGWLGAVLGATMTFLIVRYLAHDYVQRTVASRSARFRRVDERFAQDGFRWMLVLRVVMGLAPPLNWAIGATSIPLASYVGGTAIGLIPIVGLYVYFGGSIANAMETGDWLTPEVLVPAALVGLLLVGAIVFGRRLLSE
jgi:uncharacterized membrane protein YdjX (TVP38/TMEM64 family)